MSDFVTTVIAVLTEQGLHGSLDRKTLTLTDGRVLRLVGDRLLARRSDSDDTLLVLGDLTFIRQGDWLDLTNIRNTVSWTKKGGFYLAGWPSKTVVASGKIKPLSSLVAADDDIVELEEEIEIEDDLEIAVPIVSKTMSPVVAELRARSVAAKARAAGVQA